MRKSFPAHVLTFLLACCASDTLAPASVVLFSLSVNDSPAALTTGREEYSRTRLSFESAAPLASIQLPPITAGEPQSGLISVSFVAPLNASVSGSVMELDGAGLHGYPHVGLSEGATQPSGPYLRSPPGDHTHLLAAQFLDADQSMPVLDPIAHEARSEVVGLAFIGAANAGSGDFQFRSTIPILGLSALGIFSLGALYLIARRRSA